MKDPPGIGFDDKTFGYIDSTFYIVYGFFLFISGSMGDKYSIRLLIGFGFIAVCALHVPMGLGGLWQIRTMWYYTALFFLSGIFQSVGWPLCIALMTNWFPKKGRGFIFGAWSSCVNLGNIWGTLICTFCKEVMDFNWEWTWITLNMTILVMGILNLMFLVAKPEFVGLKIEEEPEEDLKQNIKTTVNKNYTRDNQQETESII